jgi:hypothetical protein
MFRQIIVGGMLRTSVQNVPALPLWDSQSLAGLPAKALLIGKTTKNY